jgi:phosphoglycolate phosphatase
MARRTLLLDLDGTLWDSRPWYAELLAGVSGGSAAELEDKLALATTVVRLAKELGVSKSRLIREASNSTASLRLYDGARQTLDDLKDQATLMGVVTNLPSWLVAPMAKRTGLQGYFEVIITPRPGVPAKPQPHGIRKALEVMERDADPNAWFVGDSTTDAVAARAAGVRFAWAAYGYATAPPPGTAMVMHRFQDLRRL